MAELQIDFKTMSEPPPPVEKENKKIMYLFQWSVSNYGPGLNQLMGVNEHNDARQMLARYRSFCERNRALKWLSPDFVEQTLTRLNLLPEPQPALYITRSGTLPVFDWAAVVPTGIVLADGDHISITAPDPSLVFLGVVNSLLPGETDVLIGDMVFIPKETKDVDEALKRRDVLNCTIVPFENVAEWMGPDRSKTMCLASETRVLSVRGSNLEF